MTYQVELALCIVEPSVSRIDSKTSMYVFVSGDAHDNPNNPSKEPKK